MDTTRMFIDRWTKKENVAYADNGILFSFKKKAVPAHTTTRINFKDILLSEINQSQKDKYCVIPLLWIT